MAVSMRLKLMAAAAAAAALTFGACGGESNNSDDDNKDGGTSAAQDSGAKTDATTAGGADASLEIPIADLDDGVAGKPCMADKDCAGKNASCLFGACTGACDSNANCGAGGSCVSAVRNQTGACVKVCTSNSECMQGQDCREGIAVSDILDDFAGAVAEAGVSFEGIDAGVDVQVSNLPKSCGPSLGTVELPDGVVGKTCTGAAQCAPGGCLTVLNLGAERFPSGYCSGKCISDSQCGAGGACYKNPLAAAIKTEGDCLLGCKQSSDCRANQTCRTSEFLFDSKMYCFPNAVAAPDAGTPDGG